MEPRVPYWEGVIEADGAVKPIEIYQDEDGRVDIWIDGNYADDIVEIDDLYGRLYPSLVEYRTGYYNPTPVEDVWPKQG